MIMCSYKKIAISNRKLCEASLEKQIEIIARKNKPDMFILREKDLSEADYMLLAEKIIKVCNKNEIEPIIHKYINVALKLDYRKIHLSLDDFLLNKNKTASFEQIGVSVHSLEAAVKAEKNGADYLIAGHIFETDCKKGLKGRGLAFLTEICEGTDIPVYAIGGINSENAASVINSGSQGICMMSEYMKIK